MFPSSHKGFCRLDTCPAWTCWNSLFFRWCSVRRADTIQGAIQSPPDGARETRKLNVRLRCKHLRLHDPHIGRIVCVCFFLITGVCQNKEALRWGCVDPRCMGREPLSTKPSQTNIHCSPSSNPLRFCDQPDFKAEAAIIPGRKKKALIVGTVCWELSKNCVPFRPWFCPPDIKLSRTLTSVGGNSLPSETCWWDNINRYVGM